MTTETYLEGGLEKILSPSDFNDTCPRCDTAFKLGFYAAILKKRGERSFLCDKCKAGPYADYDSCSTRYKKLFGKDRHADL